MSNKKLINARYWMCIIGAADNKELPNGCDLPMRDSVQKAYRNITGQDDHSTWSGWGLTEDRKDVVSAVWNMGESDPLYVAIEAMLKGASRIKSSELLGNAEQFRDEMRDDLDKLVEPSPEQDELRYLRAEYEANKDKVWTDADMSKKDAEIERLRELIEKAFNEYNSLWEMSVEHLAFVWQQFKTENNL